MLYYVKNKFKYSKGKRIYPYCIFDSPHSHPSVKELPRLLVIEVRNHFVEQFDKLAARTVREVEFIL